MKSNKNKAFTLIEVLVVIAIMGVLASVILPYLMTGRNKAKIASIKVNLKSIAPQMEFYYFENGSSYSGINPTSPNFYHPLTTCQGTLAPIVSSMTNQGAIVRCLSMNIPSNLDVYQRWGVTALVSGASTPLEAYSPSLIGVFKWDTQGVNSSGAFVTPDVPMNWNTANNACALSGGRLPTVEEYKTLYDAIVQAGATHASFGFLGEYYWSSTMNPAIPSDAYAVHFGPPNQNGGAVFFYSKNGASYVRCVR